MDLILSDMRIVEEAVEAVRYLERGEWGMAGTSVAHVYLSGYMPGGPMFLEVKGADADAARDWAALRSFWLSLGRLHVDPAKLIAIRGLGSSMPLATLMQGAVLDLGHASYAEQTEFVAEWQAYRDAIASQDQALFDHMRLLDAHEPKHQGD